MSKRQHERYALNQSPLFRIRGKGQFERIIGIEWDSVPDLIASNYYRVWINEKGREIQQPIGKLETLHRRLGGFLSRIELPDYLYSKRGRSYADNARQHVGDVPLVKTDIHKFYPSTTWFMVRRMFKEDFDCADDVARRLADICCYRQEHLPTGSSISGRIAFFAARQLFDGVAKIAMERGCRMTTYVDDITVSGESASKTLLDEIRKIVHRHGLKTKHTKSFSFSANAAKPVTGTVIKGNELRLPNQRHKKLHEVRKNFEKATASERVHIQRVLQGRIQEAKQVVG
jgi:hypothetical protein